jgi:hypothetical protein
VATAGTWERSRGEARFTPRFAATPAIEFAIVARDDRNDEWRELARVKVPATNMAPRTTVEAIDPGVESVPANLLRFSVTFSSVMEEGSVAGHIHLLDENGTVIAGALLEMPPELWDRDRRRLTVLLEPGRIKRGLQPHVQAGAPLHEGGEVTLVVDSDIRDATGSPLVEAARQTLRVGPPIRSRIDPTVWEVNWPQAPTDPLVVRFGRPLDRALVHRYLRPIDGQGVPVDGHASLDETAERWVFTPAAGAHDLRLRIDARLEDLAGNSVRRVFDRDLDRPEDDGIDATEIILSRDVLPGQGGN